MFAKSVKSSLKATTRNDTHDNEARQSRWTRLLNMNSPRMVWKAINWKGEVLSDVKNDEPSDDQFKMHFENLLKPTAENTLDLNSDCHGPYIPVTDDPITFDEVTEAISKSKTNCSGGPSGLPSGIFRHFPENWIVFLCLLFNTIFSFHSYPAAWCISRLVTVFKKGAKSLCDNYRGISIMDSVAKLFDTIICARLQRWFVPDREQAGAQRGRGCMELVVTLRLLIDYAISKKRKLFIVFVDFSKAYDKVPRKALIDALIALGCGFTMLCMIAAMYENSQVILGAALIYVTAGVRQGSPSSCLLFTLYVNTLIRDLKTACGADGFLGTLHCLMQMDDTVIFSTSREGITKKIKILERFCSKSGMVVNLKKTEFFVLNGNEDDQQNIVGDSLVIKPCKSYVYLGVAFTSCGKFQPSLKKHASDKHCHLLKFVSFVTKNSNYPFWIKKKVLDSALLSALTYGCESWMSENLQPMQSSYMAAIKTLLGVRKTTTNDLCLIEAGYPTLKGFVKENQVNFFSMLIEDRRGYDDDPFWRVWCMCLRANTPCARYVNNLLNNPDVRTRDIENMRQRVLAAEGSKFVTYREMNPSLDIHNVYNSDVPEYQRISFSKFRLSSHDLAIEKGRWSRTPRDRRLCVCNSVQTELHVISSCSETQHIRDHHPNIDCSSFATFFSSDAGAVCRITHRCLDQFE